MINLVDESSTYEIIHPSGATFVMRHWTLAMQEETDKKCVVIDSSGRITDYKVSLERELKLKNAVSDWRGIMLDSTEALCTDENKKKLPVGVALWLVREIDERAGLRMTAEEKKN